MKAIILAAGQGSRLLPLTQETPKCLLNVAGMTILEYQLVTLHSVGIKDVVLIGGFRVDKLRDYALQYVAAHGLDMRLKIINNREYHVTNNLYSLWLARDEMNSDFVVINGDNVFERKALQKVLHHTTQTASVAIHKNPTYDNEDMKIRLVGNRVVEISKQINSFEAHGESIGLRAFRGAGVNAFKYGMDMAMIEDVRRKAYFVNAIQHMIDGGHQVEYVDVTEFKYGELDFPEDLKKLDVEMSGMMKQAIMTHAPRVRSTPSYDATGLKKAS